MAADPSELDAEALWYVGVGRAEIRNETISEPGPGEVRVRAFYSAISRGTESLVSAGRVPETEYERMRAPFMGGAFPFPVKYGYAMVGRVERGPPELRDRLVFALHPHQSVFNVPAEAVLPIPDDVPAARAVLAANMETALNAAWDAAPTPADRIAIVGAGVVGALVAWLCGRIPGARVTMVDIEPTRENLARALGVAFSAPGAALGDCDLVVHASATAAGLATALGLAGDEATVLEMSWHGAGEVAIPLGGAFHSRRLKLVSSQVGRVAPSHRARWTHRRRLAAALNLLADLRLDALIAPAVPFHQLPSRLPDILASGSGVLCQPVAYPAAP
jgi:NADPH:quinone reductase-like Zn-dependent oxidoreductase